MILFKTVTHFPSMRGRLIPQPSFQVQHGAGEEENNCGCRMPPDEQMGRRRLPKLCTVSVKPPLTCSPPNALLLACPTPDSPLSSSGHLCSAAVLVGPLVVLCFCYTKLVTHFLSVLKPHTDPIYKIVKNLIMSNVFTF